MSLNKKTGPSFTLPRRLDRCALVWALVLAVLCLGASCTVPCKRLLQKCCTSIAASAMWRSSRALWLPAHRLTTSTTRAIALCSLPAMRVMLRVLNYFSRAVQIPLLPTMSAARRCWSPPMVATRHACKYCSRPAPRPPSSMARGELRCMLALTRAMPMWHGSCCPPWRAQMCIRRTTAVRRRCLSHAMRAMRRWSS